jgi:folylpolyglutamate synthase/dihydropteroate synthase
METTTAVWQQPLSLTEVQDHVEILGHTVEAIAKEKSGIIKRGRPVVVSALVPEPALAVIAETARALEAPLLLVPPATWQSQEEEEEEEEEEMAIFTGTTLYPLNRHLRCSPPGGSIMRRGFHQRARGFFPSR